MESKDKTHKQKKQFLMKLGISRGDLPKAAKSLLEIVARVKPSQLPEIQAAECMCEKDV